MKDKNPKFEEIEGSHILGGTVSRGQGRGGGVDSTLLLGTLTETMVNRSLRKRHMTSVCLL
jgi:hypothetical protein